VTPTRLRLPIRARTQFARIVTIRLPTYTRYSTFTAYYKIREDPTPNYE